MKKLFALVLCLVMFMSVSASAEYSYTEYTYDESLFTEIGGEWLALDGLGLKFYLPDVYLQAELADALAASGVIAAFATEDSSSVFTIAYGPAVDAAGNAVTTMEDLGAYYTAIGATNVDVIIVNGIPVLTSLLPETDLLSYSVLFADSTQCVLSFTPASDANTALLAGLMCSTLMLAE